MCVYFRRKTTFPTLPGGDARESECVTESPTLYKESVGMGTRESEVSGLGVLWCNVRLSCTEHLDGRVTVSLYRALGRVVTVAAFTY